MKSNKTLSRFVLVTSLTIVSSTAALAAEPDALIKATTSHPAAPAALKDGAFPRMDEAEMLTVESATAKAQYYSHQAETFRSLGGVGYKAGLVQRAEASAARYAALAADLQSSAVEQPPRSPEAEHYARLAEQYRRMGGVAYKAGLVQGAEALQRRYELTVVTEVPMVLAVNGSTCASKPVVCSRGSVN